MNVSATRRAGLRRAVLLLPLAMAIPVIILCERSQIGKATRAIAPPPDGH
jgi:branched-subunit amino acid ABC-type transport system permease component